MARDDGNSTVSLYLPTTTLQRIDQAAEREGMSRSAYVLSWLPECYDTPTDAQSEPAASNGHAVHR